MMIISLTIYTYINNMHFKHMGDMLFFLNMKDFFFRLVHVSSCRHLCKKYIHDLTCAYCFSSANVRLILLFFQKGSSPFSSITRVSRRTLKN